MKLYRLREEDKKFLWALLSAIGIVFLWRGIWEVSYEIPILENVYVVLFVGLFILTITGLIYREFDVFGQRIYKLQKLMHDVQIETKKGTTYMIHYFDSINGDTHKLNSKELHDVEIDFIVTNEKNHERFIPLRRITKVQKGKKTIWRK